MGGLAGTSAAQALPAVAVGGNGAPPAAGASLGSPGERIVGLPPAVLEPLMPNGDDGGAKTLGAVVIALLVVTLAFAMLHGRFDRNEPKLTSAPLDGHDETLDFE